MPLVFSDSEFPTTVTKSIFLAGPTPRLKVGHEVNMHWRHEALEYLEEIGYDGHVFIPIPRDHFSLDKEVVNEVDYEAQLEWEHKALSRCDVIFFFVARTEENMGLTTNVEFGRYIDSGRVVYARTTDATHVRYLDALAEKVGLPVLGLNDGLDECVSRIGEGDERYGGECLVPLLFWQSEQFQTWYNSHANQGNELQGFEAKSVITNDNFRSLFGFSAWVKLLIRKENRIKDCEWIFSRTTASYTVPYFVNENGTRSYVLVRDFRSTSSNPKGYVYELPGGSIEDNLSPVENAMKELEEETGLVIKDESRFVNLGTRQAFAIFCTSLIVAYAVEINKAELDFVMEKTAKGETLGENDEERIKLCVINERSLISRFNDFPLDLTTLGLIQLTTIIDSNNKTILPSAKLPSTAYWQK